MRRLRLFALFLAWLPLALVGMYVMIPGWGQIVMAYAALVLGALMLLALLAVLIWVTYKEITDSDWSR